MVLHKPLVMNSEYDSSVPKLVRAHKSNDNDARQITAK